MGTPCSRVMVKQATGRAAAAELERDNAAHRAEDYRTQLVAAQDKLRAAADTAALRTERDDARARTETAQALLRESYRNASHRHDPSWLPPGQVLLTKNQLIRRRRRGAAGAQLLVQRLG
jgi:hypothetical protein